MTKTIDRLTRRGFVASAAALAGTAATGLPARAADYPERNISVVVPTREGGGADRNLRAFTEVWKTYLDTNFEPGFFPGASGRVGYEIFMGKNEPDAYSLLFGNMGPEVLNWVVEAPTFNLDDFLYFGQVDVDPGCVFVGNDSPIQSIDDLVAEGKKRKLNVGTSRLAHPASIGILLLGEETGAEFNLIPLSGGKNTVAGAVTGEMDFSVLTSGTVASAGDSVRTLLVFNDENVLGEALDNAPTMNGHFGMDSPPMLSARAFGIHKAAVDAYPDRFERLQTTFRQVFDDPAYKEAVTSLGGFWEYVQFGGIDVCAEYTKDMLEIGERFKPLLTGKPA